MNWGSNAWAYFENHANQDGGLIGLNTHGIKNETTGFDLYFADVYFSDGPQANKTYKGVMMFVSPDQEILVAPGGHFLHREDTDIPRNLTLDTVMMEGFKD